MRVRTVLVVDDDPRILDMIQVALEAEGYHVLTAVNTTALATAHEMQPDLILLDIWMPGMDGIAMSLLLEADRATTHIPVVIMSADPAALNPALDLPVQDSLAKPFTIAELEAMVARWVPRAEEESSYD